ncbi:MAG: FKBP-type peptidyl-prolyl cis-trans isomerase [bacterium]|nr:FKBP-type peptidyl-prolyl cis-trans isomerase [bacterium]
MRFLLNRILLFTTALALIVSVAAQAEKKADSSQAAEPKIIKPEPAKVSNKGRPTLLMAGDTIVTTSGLKYIEIKPGTGGSPQKGQRVTVHYVGTLLDGKIFSSSRTNGAPFEFAIGVGQVIKGWDEGISSMKIGGTRKFIIPAELAYADKGHPAGVPPNATIVFEVELLGIR